MFINGYITSINHNYELINIRNHTETTKIKYIKQLKDKLCKEIKYDIKDSKNVSNNMIRFLIENNF